MNRSYVLASKPKIAMARVVDFVGYRLFRSNTVDVPFNRILFLQLDHLGDLIFSTAAIEAIRQVYPSSTIISVTGSWARGIIEGNSNIDEIIEFDAPWFSRDKNTNRIKGIKELSKILTELRPDMVIDFRGDLRHNIAMYLAKIPHRIGFGITGGGFLLTREVEYPFESHAVLRHMSIPKALGAQFDESDLKLKLYLSEEEEAWVEQFMAAYNLNDRTLIGIHPETGTQAKQWPMQNFVRTMELLEKRLADKSPLFIVTGTSPHGLNSHNIVDLGGKLTLKQLAAIQSKLDLFICGDTGPLHMATAVDCRTVAIYSGTNDLNIWEPWGGNAKVLQATVDCAPCGRSNCSDNKCMTAVTPRMVLESSLELLL